MIPFKNGKPVDECDIPDGTYYTVPEFAKMLDVPQVTVRQWIKRGQISCYKYCGQNFIPLDAYVVYKQNCRKKNCHVK